MQPLNYSSRKSRPTADNSFDAKIAGSKGPVVATVVPRGPVLNLQPVLDRILISDPDAGQSGETNMLGGVHLPGNVVRSQFVANARVKVVAIGPEVKCVKAGDDVLVPRGAVQQIAWDGNSYFWANEAAVLAIVKT